jgi:hypothetical protein
MEDLIRTRAYFKWLWRADKSVRSELDDWLAAEAEELGLDVIELASEVDWPKLSFTQDDIWIGADRIAKLFDLLAPRLKKRRAGSYFLSVIEDYQDYLTSSDPVEEDYARRQGHNVLHILRLFASLKMLVGNDFNRTATHSVLKELKDLFGHNRTAFETAEFSVYSAACIQRQVGKPVMFINEGSESRPDLQVNNIAYVECKDIHTANRENLAQALGDNLAKARSQLAKAQASRRLSAAGVCIDIPWGMLPLKDPEWEVVRQSLSGADAPQFVLLSCSGINESTNAVGFPVAVCLVWSQSGIPFFQDLLRRLTRVSYRMLADGFEEIVH